MIGAGEGGHPFAFRPFPGKRRLKLGAMRCLCKSNRSRMKDVKNEKPPVEMGDKPANIPNTKGGVIAKKDAKKTEGGTKE